MRLLLDACSLIFLAKADLLDVAYQTYDSLMITQVIYNEAVEKGKRAHHPDAFILEKWTQSKRITIIDFSHDKIVGNLNLGSGEVSLISYALQSSEPLVLCIDDLKARRIAANLGVEVISTEFILFEALKKRIITLEEFEERLTRLGRVAGYTADRMMLSLKIAFLIESGDK